MTTESPRSLPEIRRVKARFCLHCGTPLEDRWFEEDQRFRQQCRQCPYVHYENPKVLVCGLVTCKGRLLMCQRAIEPGRGLWALPGGFMECGETLAEGTAREIREETGVVIDPTTLLLYNVASLTDLAEVYVTFRAEVSDTSVTPGVESLRAEYFPFADLPWSQFAFHQNEPYLRRFFEEYARSHFGIHVSHAGFRGEGLQSFPLGPDR